VSYKLIVAVVRLSCVDAVEEAVRAAGAGGICMAPVAGVGEYSNFFRRNSNVRRARVEVYAPADQAEAIADAIASAACSGTSGDGIVAILPVQSFQHLSERVDAGA